MPQPPAPHHTDAENAEDTVSTAPQRRALEEMSRHLLDELNTMVQQQETRAREFAARTHSLSHLPQGAAETAAAPKPQRRNPTATGPTIPPLTTERPTPPSDYTRAPSRPRPRVAPQPENAGGEKKLGFWFMIIVWLVIFFLLRACN